MGRGYMDLCDFDNIDNIKELIIYIKKIKEGENCYRRYILHFHEKWEKDKSKGIRIKVGKYIWGSKVQVPEYYKIDDVFEGKSFTNIANFFRENNVVYISDLCEDILLELMFYPTIGYYGFMDVLNILFIDEFRHKDESSTSDSNNIDAFKHTETLKSPSTEVIDGSSNAAAIVVEDLTKMDDEILEMDVLNDNTLVELLGFNNSIKQKIDKENEMILKAIDSYRVLLDYVTVLGSKNNELNKKIHLLSEEKEKEIQMLRNKILQVTNAKNREIEILNKEFNEFKESKLKEVNSLNRKIEEIEDEKNRIAEKLKGEIAAIKETYDRQLNILNSDYDLFKKEKEEEIDNLKRELLQLQMEREEDKKILQEFENMIRIMEKIKGLFKKNKDFS